MRQKEWAFEDWPMKRGETDTYRIFCSSSATTYCTRHVNAIKGGGGGGGGASLTRYERSTSGWNTTANKIRLNLQHHGHGVAATASTRWDGTLTTCRCRRKATDASTQPTLVLGTGCCDLQSRAKEGRRCYSSVMARKNLTPSDLVAYLEDLAPGEIVLGRTFLDHGDT